MSEQEEPGPEANFEKKKKKKKKKKTHSVFYLLIHMVRKDSSQLPRSGLSLMHQPSHQLKCH